MVEKGVDYVLGRHVMEDKKVLLRKDRADDRWKDKLDYVKT